MKTTFKFIIAAMAASAVLTSCQKEMAIDNTASSTDGIRVISASFSTPTKSTLDGKTPKFVGGEKIMVSNDESSQECTISVNGGVASFLTTLTGTLTAVYPSTAAKMNEGDVIDNSAVLVSTVQDGTFASANIAMATGITTSATFTNKTAVIKITPGAGVNTKYVEVITAGPEISNDVPEGSTFTKLNKIHVNTTSADPVYVSILVPSGLKIQNLSFADGSNIKTAKDNTTAIAVNTINTVGNTGWDTPYVEINGLKWATMNVGATSKTEAGHYFAWGYAEGCVRNTAGDGWVLASDNTTAKQFNTTDFPNRDASSFQDAATSNWGGSWRMPTGGTNAGDFIDLFRACGITSDKCTPTSGGGTETENKGVYWCGDYSGKKGVLFIAEDNGTHLFFPAAGHGDDAELVVETDGYDHLGYYLSSTNTPIATMAYCLYIGKGTNKVAAGGTSKYFGWSVRPVSD